MTLSNGPSAQHTIKGMRNEASFATRQLVISDVGCIIATGTIIELELTPLRTRQQGIISKAYLGLGG